jgi:hypothetical protein
MRDDEGYQIPDLPVLIVQAKSLKEAKRKVLAATSQFGEVKSDGLFNFLKTAELDHAEVLKNIQLPEINLERFELTYYPPPELQPSPSPEPRKTDVAAHERNLGGATEETGRTCPKCGYELADDE